MPKILALLISSILIIIFNYAYAIIDEPPIEFVNPTLYEPPIEFVDPTRPQTDTPHVIPSDPNARSTDTSSSSSTQDSYYPLFLDEQLSKNVYFIRDIYNKVEYFKNETIMMRVGVVNKKEYPISNVTINEEIPSELEINWTSLKIMKNDLDISINEFQENETNVFKKYKDNNYVINLGTINGSEHKYLKINLTTRQSGKYVFNPATLFYKNQLYENASIESPQIFLNIINHNPKITKILIRPNPVRKNLARAFTEDVLLSATFDDIDEYDFNKWEIWSSIDGLLGAGRINQTESNSYNLSVIKNNLSTGVHSIVFKVFDKDDEYSEESLMLTVEEYIFNIIPKKYDWTIFLAFFGLFVEIILREKYTIIYTIEFKTIFSAFLIFLIISGYIPISPLLIFIGITSGIILIVKIFKYYDLN